MKKEKTMMFPKKVIFGGFALSLFTISFTPAQADYCDDIHAKVAQWQSDFAREQVEEARVGLITPMPQTDLALCVVALKVKAEAEELFDSSGDTCYSVPNLLSDTSKEGDLGMSTIVGLYHCTR